MNALKLSGSVVAVIVLAACGGSDNERTEPADPPVVGITFPPIYSTSTSDSITVHAVALGLSNKLTSISLNGDGIDEEGQEPNAQGLYKFFEAGITAEGQNQMTVTASDAELSDQADIFMVHGSSWMVERGIQYDEEGASALVVDAARGELLRINLDEGTNEGTKTIVSGNGVGVNLVMPEDMTLDGDGNAWVVDSGLSKLVKIDTSDGSQMEIFDGDGADLFKKPIAVALDNEKIAFVLDVGNEKIYQIDLDESDESDGLGAGDSIDFSDSSSEKLDLVLPLDLVYDNDNGRLLITDSATDSIIAIETDGTRSALVGGSALDDQTPFSALQNITLIGNNSAYVSDLNYGVAEINIGPTKIKFIPSTVFLRPGETRKVVVSIDEPLFAADEDGSLIIELNLDDTEFTSNVTQIEWVQDSWQDEKIFYISAKEGASEAQSIEINADDVISNVELYQNFDPKFTAIIVENNPSLSPSALTLGPDKQLLVVDNYLGVIVQVATENDSPVFKGQRDYLQGGASNPSEGDTPAQLTSLAADHRVGRLSGLASNADQSSLYTIDRDLAELRELQPTFYLSGLAYDRVFQSIIGANGELKFSANSLMPLSTDENVAIPDGTYTDISATGGMGDDAEFELTVAEGKVTAFQVTTEGQGYSFGDTITLGVSVEGFDLSHLQLKLSDAVDFIDPRQVAVEFTSNNTVSNFYVVDAGRDEVIQIDGENNRKVFSSADGISVFEDPRAAVVVENSLYVLESAGSIIIIDISESGSGSRTKLDGFSLSDSRAMVVDENGENFYVASTSEIKRVKISDGTTDPFLVNIGPNAEIVDIVLDYDNQRILVLEASSRKVFEVSTIDPSLDLNDDPITGPSTPNTADPFIAPIKMIYNRNYQWLYVLDETLRSLHAVDLRKRDYGQGQELDAQRVVIMQGTALNQLQD